MLIMLSDPIAVELSLLYYSIIIIIIINISISRFWQNCIILINRVIRDQMLFYSTLEGNKEPIFEVDQLTGNHLRTPKASNIVRYLTACYIIIVRIDKCYMADDRSPMSGVTKKN